MLQRIAGLVILALGTALLTFQVMAGPDGSVLLTLLSLILTAFGAVVNLESGKEKPRERL